MRIGLDLDGVVADWVGSAKQILRDRGSVIPNIDPPYWDWLKDQARPEDWKFLWGPGMRWSYQSANPYTGAVDFARELRTLGDVIIMTSRPEGSWTATIQWWKDHMKYTPAGYNFFSSGTEKHKVNVDVFIEDTAEYAEEYGMWDKNTDCKIFLLDRSWNSGYTSYIVNRAMNYEEILREIERLKNEESE